MQKALLQAEEALAAGNFPVGCVIEYQGEVVASGRRENSSTDDSINELDHGEIQALRSLLESGKEIELSGVTVYCTMEPCLMCFSTLLVNGVKKIVFSYEDAMGGGTNLPLHLLSPLYRDLEVTVERHILREESLGLFKQFFEDPANVYLKGTLLAEYTLTQNLKNT